MLRPSFVPPGPIPELRDYTRMRVDLVRDRTRYWQLLEDALIRVSSVASSLTTTSCRDMIEHRFDAIEIQDSGAPDGPRNIVSATTLAEHLDEQIIESGVLAHSTVRWRGSGHDRVPHHLAATTYFLERSQSRTATA